MKTALALVMSFAVTAIAAPPTDYPLRVIGTNLCNLTPHFKWFTNGAVGKSPMWKWQYFDGRISSISGNSVLVSPAPRPPPLRLTPSQRAGAYAGSRPAEVPGQSFRLFCLTNYPGAKTAKDGDSTKCFATEIGVMQFRDSDGSLRTVALYDHGIPVTNATPSMK